MNEPVEKPQVPCMQKCICVLWPSFLVAGIATGLFFSAFDPAELFPFGSDTGLSRLGAYTIGFFLFWVMSALSAIGTLYFAMTNCQTRKASETGH